MYIVESDKYFNNKYKALLRSHGNTLDMYVVDSDKYFHNKCKAFCVPMATLWIYIYIYCLYIYIHIVDSDKCVNNKKEGIVFFTVTIITRMHPFYVYCLLGSVELSPQKFLSEKSNYV